MDAHAADRPACCVCCHAVVAVRLEQNLQQRKQLQQQSDAFELQRRAFSPLGGLPSGRGGLLGNSSSSSADASSHLNVDELRQDLEVVLRRV